MNGYQKAAKFDSLICSLLKKTPITHEPRAWLTFARTVKTTLTMIEKEAYRQVKYNIEKSQQTDEIITAFNNINQGGD